MIDKTDKKEELFRKRIKEIRGADMGAMALAKERQDYRVKVPNSLGRLEEISIRLAGITGKPYGNTVGRQVILLMCADNGVVEEGVASAPQSVTLMQTINFTKKITGVGAQAAYFGIDLLPIDVGVKLPIPEEYLTDQMRKPDGSLSDLVVDRRIADGTKNFIKEPAMSREEAIAAFLVGMEAVDAAAEAGKELIGVGEMGIGNTTTASAIICALTGADVEDVVGRGGGLDDRGLSLKKKVVLEGLGKYGGKDPIELARSIGGFDICAMAGAYLGGGIHRIPMVVDGVISIAAALLAREIVPEITDFMFTSHRSLEGGYAAAARALAITPMYDLGMKLGEGSGCPIAFKIIEAAASVINGMWSLEEAQVDAEYLEPLRKGDNF